MATSLFVFVTFIAVFNADCNLLESSKYIDTESKDAITSMCSKEASSLTEWEKYQCEYIQNRDSYQKCWPQRRMSTCPVGELRGAIFLYHGFSACPDQYNDLAPKLQSECYHVYLMTTLGHGLNRCSETSTVNTTGCVPSILNDTFISETYGSNAWLYNESSMPDTRQPYIEFVTSMISIIENEVDIIKSCEISANGNYNADNLEVAVGGLSFGAPLSAATVVLSGANSIFTKYILMSPFFGISAGPIDNAVYKCTLNSNSFKDCLGDYFGGTGFDLSDDDEDQIGDMLSTALSAYVDIDFIDASYETINLLVRKLLEWLVENPDAINDEKVYDAFNINMPWGKQCEYDILERNRGGFCQFKLRKLVAAHSFASYIIEQLSEVEVDQSVETFLGLVERDGQTRNGLVVDYVNKYYDNSKQIIHNKVTNCMWLIAQECQEEDFDGQIDNACGVPHSSMSHPDNLGINPKIMYWEETYHTGLIAFLNNGVSASFPDNFVHKSKWDLTRNQCIYFDVTAPPKILVSQIPSLLKIGFKIVWDDITEKIENEFLNAISELTGVPRGVLELTKHKKRTSVSTNAETVGKEELVEYQMSLDRESAQIFRVLFENNNVLKIANYSIEYAKIDGQKYNVSNVTERNEVVVNNVNAENDNLEWSLIAFIILLVVDVIGIIAAVIYWKRQKNVKRTDVYNQF